MKVSIYINESYTGKTRNRPALKQLINDLKENDTIVACDLSRISRSVKDFNELLEHTTVQWLENYKGRTAGCLFTSKQNGNTLFLPAAGYIEGDGVFSDEETGYYWTADVCQYNDNTAWYLKFIGAHLQMRTHYRIHGCTVRAVLK